MRQSRFSRLFPFAFLWALILIPPADGQTESAPVPSLPTASADTTTMPNSSSKAGWPSPIADRGVYSFLLFDNLEYRKDELNWGLQGWQGGDRNRLWYKSEGVQNTTSSSKGGSEGDVQALYGRLISPYFDFQAGVRYARRWGEGLSRSRAYAVVGLQGIAPYRFDIEPSLQVSHQGKVQFRVAATYDLLLTQRLVLQPRMETSVAVQKDIEFGILSHVNDSQVDVHLRYEVRREFAPFVGLSWRQGFGSKTLAAAGNFEPSSVSAVVGVRIWH